MSGTKSDSDVILSLFRKYPNCLSSCFDGRGDGFGVGKHEVGTLKMLDAVAGRVNLPGNFTIGGSEGQCFSQMKVFAGSTTKFSREGNTANHFCLSARPWVF